MRPHHGCPVHRDMGCNEMLNEERSSHELCCSSWYSCLEDVSGREMV